MKNKTLRALCEGAIMVAMAQVLGYLKLYELPQGGSITLSMLPIMIYCNRHGLKYGLISGFSLGILQLVLDGAYTWGWQSIIFDYILAYGLLGVAGAFYKQKKGIYTGTLTGCLLRYISHIISGYFFVSTMTSFDIAGIHTSSPWIYSIIYNGLYMIPDTILVLIICALLNKTLKRYKPVN